MASFSRSDEYSRFIQSLTLPSAALFILLAGSTVTAYTFFLENSKINIAGSILFASGIILSFKSAKKFMLVKNAGMLKNSFRIFFFCLIFISCTVINHINIKNLALQHEIKKTGTHVATVTDIVQKRYSDEIILKINSGNINLSGTLTSNSLKIGDEIKISGGIKKISTSSPFSIYMARKGIYYTADLEDNFEICKKSAPATREIIRNRISANCDKIFSEKTSGIMKGMYFGSTAFIDKESAISYRKAGITHIISASGFNVAIITLLPLFALGAIGVKKRFAMLAVLPMVFLYFYLTDMPVSLLRAVIMFSVFSVQFFFGTEKNILNSIFLAGVIIILFFPYELYSLGFQLSFGATLGIILFYKNYLKSLRFLPRLIRSSLALTISAQIITIPVIAVTLSELNINGLATNMIAVPLMSLIMNFSIAANVIYAASANAGAVAGQLTDLIYSATAVFIDFMAGTGGHFFIDTIGPGALMIFACLAIPLIPCLPYKKFSSAGIIFFVSGSLFLYSAPANSYEAIKFTNFSGPAYLARNGRNCILFGEISGHEKASAIIKEIEKVPMSRISIYLNNADYDNISACRTIVRNCMVDSCTIPEYYSPGKHIRGFFDHLEKDSIALKIKNFEKEKISHKTSMTGIEKYPFLENKIIDSVLKEFDHYTERIIIEK